MFVSFHHADQGYKDEFVDIVEDDIVDISVEDGDIDETLEIMRSTGQSNPLTPKKNTPKRRLASQSGIADGFGLSKKGSNTEEDLHCSVVWLGFSYTNSIRLPSSP